MISIIKSISTIWWVFQGIFLVLNSIVATMKYNQPIIKWDLIVGFCLIAAALLRYSKDTILPSFSNIFIFIYSIAFVVLVSIIMYFGHVSSDLLVKLYIISFFNIIISLIAFIH